MVRVDRLVVVPLKQLKSLFDSPMYLMEKREDKLLDYDSWKNKVSSTQNRERVAEVSVSKAIGILVMGWTWLAV